ncbi:MULTISPECIES: YfaZ family outer membrane protein [Halomonadaceae]|uniref:YfaZ family protein n=2 Tax=Halomonadaceae TaxID=28256 RepID=A0ABS6ZSD9_9GAMM|nr:MULTISPECIES: YfaZ family outer membrane protein [Halomonas]MBW6392998.1 YfaZ family protein [Halomonas antri]QTP60974.1 hypothetical protein HNO53_21010 [Halomonas sulfidivorans]
MKTFVKHLATASVLGGALFVAAGAHAAGSLDLNLGADAMQFEAAAEITQGVALGGGVINSEYREDATIYHAQLLGVQRNRERDVGIGARWTQFDTDYGDGGGVGLGGYGYVYLPQAPDVSLGGYGFYTPGIATSGDLDDGYEVGVRARYAFTPNVDGYVGLRQTTADFDNRHGSRTLDRGAQVGVRLSF